MLFDVQITFSKRSRRSPDSVDYTLVKTDTADQAKALALQWVRRDYPRCKVGDVAVSEVSEEESQKRADDAFSRL